MWSPNSKTINKINNSNLPYITNNIPYFNYQYQTPIKNFPYLEGYNNSPFQYGFHFVLDNSFSPEYSSVKQIDINRNEYIYMKEKSNILLFKSSLEKSGFKINSEIKNFQNNYEENGFSRKNLEKLFDNVKTDKILQPYKKDNINYSNNNEKNDIIKNSNNNEGNKENKNINIINNKSVNNLVKKNIDKYSINKINNVINNNIIINDYNIDKNFEKNTPKSKKIVKLFECSSSSPTNCSSIKKRRIRKTDKQIQLLSKFFKENKNWSKNQIKEISKQVGLKENKIYKWLWDHKNKNYKTFKFIVNK